MNGVECDCLQFPENFFTEKIAVGNKGEGESLFKFNSCQHVLNPFTIAKKKVVERQSIWSDMPCLHFIKEGERCSTVSRNAENAIKCNWDEPTHQEEKRAKHSYLTKCVL